MRKEKKEKKKFIFRIATDIYLTEGKTCTSSIIHGPYNNVERLNPYAIERNACHRKNVCYGGFFCSLALVLSLSLFLSLRLTNSVDMIIIASLSERVNECVKSGTRADEGKGEERIIHVMLEIPKQNHLRKIFFSWEIKQKRKRTQTTGNTKRWWNGWNDFG